MTMGTSYVEFFGFFIFFLIVCGLVALTMARGIRQDFAMKYDYYYLWYEYADSEEELLRKIKKTY
ncbi:hypothetical protein [Caldalkalibacillus salinus]|uniref:hypothetical protein n=1 Tax=Caldalkalibacillus salinus TaxID=2803787 RepID=UPI0019212E6C|nr:hypothetical protein [Caldalkalibacillus salinus]